MPLCYIQLMQKEWHPWSIGQWLAASGSVPINCNVFLQKKMSRKEKYSIVISDVFIAVWLRIIFWDVALHYCAIGPFPSQKLLQPNVITFCIMHVKLWYWKFYVNVCSGMHRWNLISIHLVFCTTLKMMADYL
jgi:hypothetical protein